MNLKKVIMPLIAFVCGLAIIPNVYAADEKVATNESTLNTAISELKSTGGTIKINDEITAEEIILIKDMEKPIIIDLNGHKIDRTEGNCVFNIENSTVTFKDSTKTDGTVEHKTGSSIYASTNSVVTIENGNYVGGLVVWGDKAKLNIQGGTVTTDGFAVSGNGAETTDSTINISGGTLTSTGTAAIYHPQTGNLTITGGSITGLVGIVARQGNVKIDGGQIKATGDASRTDRIGDAKNADGSYVQLPLGGAIVVDNTESAYEGTAHVDVIKGNFETTGTPITSFGNTATDVKVLGGNFNQDVKTMFLGEGLTQDEDGNVVDPDTIASTQTPEKQEPTKTDKADKNPATGDNILTFVLLSFVALSGALITAKVVKKA